MNGILRNCERLAFALVLAGGMTAFAQSNAEIRSAQQQLKNAGFYSGSIDGVDGSSTRTAIRNYQSANNLKVNGKLDQETAQKLGVQNSNESANANEPMNSSQTADQATDNSANREMQANNSADRMNGSNYSKHEVKEAQRCLQQKGLYKGKVDGEMGPETSSAIRHYQQSNHLNVTGQLDQQTLSSLGVTK